MGVGLLAYYPCVYHYTGGHHGSGTIGLVCTITQVDIMGVGLLAYYPCVYHYTGGHLPLRASLHRWTSWEWDYWAITLVCTITQVDTLGVGLLTYYPCVYHYTGGHHVTSMKSPNTSCKSASGVSYGMSVMGSVVIVDQTFGIFSYITWIVLFTLVLSTHGN